MIRTGVFRNSVSTIACSVLLLLAGGGALASDTVKETQTVVRPLPTAHAHNDYEHPRPLFDAMDQGFCSFEADVWWVDGKLLVAHDLEKVNPLRTLEALYLDPLRRQIQLNRGRIYSNGPTCTLLIDVKSEAAPTYAGLCKVLQGYADILTEYTPTQTTTRAITVIVSGNRAPELVVAEPLRYVALDGRLSDLESNPGTNLFPLLSDDWKKHFNWRGEGPFSETERERLLRLVQQTHKQGRRIRFWGTPDSPAVWRVLQSSGVDVIGADNLAGLGGFLRAPEH